jgi:hypothetical protein
MILAHDEKTDDSVKLADDDLDEVSGGRYVMEVEEAPEPIFKAEHTTCLSNSDAIKFCNCSNRWYGMCWAASVTYDGTDTIYYDVQCYVCGRQAEQFKVGG